jgi:hypothetical protein
MLRLRALPFAAVLLFAGSGPAFAAAAPESSLAGHLIEIIEHDGLEAGLEAYRSLSPQRKPRFAIEEQQLSIVGYRLIARGRYDDAAAFFSVALDRFPGSSVMNVAMGEACFRAERLDEAHAWYERALRLLPRDHRIDSALRRSMTMRIRARLQRLKYDSLFERYSGVYRLDDGRILAISPAEVDGWQLFNALRLVEHPDGRVRTLYPSDSTTFAAGPALMVPEPEELRVEFDARRGTIRVTDRAPRRTTRGSRLEIGTEHPVSIANGGVALAGTVSLPAMPGPHPAVVMIHGSGNAGRNSPAFGDLMNVFLMNGFAVLRYDKRGVGSSTGDWRTARIADLAADALAAVAFLRECPSIDPTRIGLLGFSQGAWIAGLGAAHDPGVAFVALVSGGAVPPREQETYRVGAELRAAAFTESEIAAALDFMQLKFDVATDRSRWPEFESAMNAADGSRWYPAYTGRWTSPEAARAIWKRNFEIDPSRYLARVRVPVLALYGTLDTLTPVDASIAALERSFAGREGLLTLAVIPRANHLLLEAHTGNLRADGELKRLTHYAPGALPMLEDWLAAIQRGGSTRDVTLRAAQ